MSTGMTNGKLAKILTIENVLGFIMGIAAVSASYALTTYKTEETAKDFIELRTTVHSEIQSRAEMQSDIRDLNTKQEQFEDKIMIHLDYQKDDLNEIKDILKAGH